MPSSLASASSLPTGAPAGAIHPINRGNIHRGEEAGSRHPWPGSRNVDSVSSPGELDSFIGTDEWRRTRPTVGPALSDRDSSRVTGSSAGVDNSDAGSSNEYASYAPFVPRAAAVARATERSGGGDGCDETGGSGGGSGSGGLAAAIGKLAVQGSDRPSSRVRGRDGMNASEEAFAGGGGNGIEDEDKYEDEGDSFRPSGRPKKGDVGSPVPVSKELEVEWGLDEAFSMAMAGLRGADRATEMAAGRPVPAAVGRDAIKGELS